MLNEMAYEIYENAKEKGFYDIDERQPVINIPERLMLIVSELGEAMEAYRKGKYSELKSWANYEHISPGSTQKIMFEEGVKDTFEDELADSVIRVLDLCAFMNIDIDRHVKLKMEYNKTRPYKHLKSC